ncbi:outer membrane protein assembly factor BamA [Chrysiogenes arsenatis]|uniref:outer membrane protein assembly factor BamA n=1 Tax=Chrysiogenes arsenatis TaxID=309797 RepID=UPI00041E11FB|nr:outer membrane protein assembly factor BamA [Chrysiogenes arsenatis]
MHDVKKKSLCVLAALAIAAGSASAATIDAIEFQGLTSMSRQAFLDKISSRELQEFNPEALSQDIKSLYSLGYFDDITVKAEVINGKFTLVFQFVERPKIASFAVEGNDLLTTDKINEVIVVKPGTIYSPDEVTRIRATLRQMYDDKGVQDVVITEQSTFDERSRSYHLVMKVEEGKKAWIEDVVFDGATAFKRSAFYKVMELREKRWYSWITDRGIFAKNKAEIDAKRIEQLYFDHGYLEVSVQKPVFELQENGNYIVRYVINEGPQYTVTTIGFRGVGDLADEGKLRAAVPQAEGEIFSSAKVTKGIENLTRLFADLGYADAYVRPVDDINQARREVALVFDVRTGDPYTIGVVSVTGNEKTRDKVIRRQMRLLEGSQYSASAIDRSKRDLTNLNFFEDVRILERKGAPQEMDVTVDVTEKPTGLFSIGAGYSSVDHLVGTLSVTQGNLFGRGQYIKANVEAGSKKALYSVTFADPFIFDSKVSFSTSIYNQVREYDYYDDERWGVSFNFGRHLFEEVRGSIGYKFEEINITEIDYDRLAYYSYIEGKSTTSAITPSLSRNTFDNYMVPTKGNRSQVYLEWAGDPIGGDNNWYKAGVLHTTYYPLIKKFVGAVNVEMRTLDAHSGAAEVPEYERLYLGGINSLRGYRYDEVGPRNAIGKATGGYSSTLANFELLYPVNEDGTLRLVAFYDVGTLSEDPTPQFDGVKSSYGGGVRWVSPMGPLRLEWGKKISPEPGTATSRWDFTIGSMF